MPIRSAWLSNDNIDWNELARRKYAILRQRAQAEAERARAAMLEANTGAAREKARYGPGGLEERSLGLAKEELERRFPYGLPKYTAETGRMNALAAHRKARATEKWASAKAQSDIAAAKRNLGELAIEKAKQVVPGETGVAVPSEEAIVNEVAKKLKKKKKTPLAEEPTNTTTEEPLVITDWLQRLLGY